MKEALQLLEAAEGLVAVCDSIDAVLEQVRAGKGSARERRLFLRHLSLHPALQRELATAQALDHLLAAATAAEWTEWFGRAAEKEVPDIVVDLVDGLADVGHAEVLRLLPDGSPRSLLTVLRSLNAYMEKRTGSERCLRGMRGARIQADIYRMLAAEPKFWRRRKPPPCGLDTKAMARLKEAKRIEELPEAYERCINQLQQRDLSLSLASVGEATPGSAASGAATPMSESDYESVFVVQAPLRLGVSSANASDNHMRSKEQGARTLNAGIELQLPGEPEPTPPLRVNARRLPEPHLLLRSRSLNFRADFEASSRGDAATQSELFFAYRRGGDEALRLVKQALVQTGIVRDNSNDVIADVAAFTGGGGLRITTRSKVSQGSGLGTSSILAAAILKALYRLTGSPLGTPEHEYPALYDQSLLLEQSIGLNSGWQDARGAYGGPSAVKDFHAPPTMGLPAPEATFLTEVDEDVFAERVVLFDTGISRAATRGLNVVLDVYLSRNERYAAIRESLELHEKMVAALRAGDYGALGRLSTRYWQLRCRLDPEATNEALQYLFEGSEIAPLIEGGLITGAGGGGFALLIARDGRSAELKQFLTELPKQAAYARSSVVEYRLDRSGIRVFTKTDAPSGV